jgi:2,3-bisphosphoglycerate-independent phosphoglycerate mutase
VLEAIGGGHDFIRLNYPNGDMVGHTGDFQAVRDLGRGGRPVAGPSDGAVRAAAGSWSITADHGNADEMLSSLAATCLNLLGYEAPEDYSPSIVEVL